MLGARVVDRRVPVRLAELPVAPALVAAGRDAGGTGRRRARWTSLVDSGQGRGAGGDGARPLLPVEPRRHERGDAARLPGAGTRACQTRRRGGDVVGLHAGTHCSGPSTSIQGSCTWCGQARPPGRVSDGPRTCPATGTCCSSARWRRARTWASCSTPTSTWPGAVVALPHLVLAGGVGQAGDAWLERVRRPPLSTAVTYRGYVPDADREALVRRRSGGRAPVVGRRLRPAGPRSHGRRHPRGGVEPGRVAGSGRGGRDSGRPRGCRQGWADALERLGHDDDWARDRGAAGLERARDLWLGRGGRGPARRLPGRCATPAAARPDAHRHRRAGAGRPGHGRRPLSGGDPESLERVARSCARTSSWCWRTQGPDCRPCHSCGSRPRSGRAPGARCGSSWSCPGWCGRPAPTCCSRRRIPRR